MARTRLVSVLTSRGTPPSSLTYSSNPASYVEDSAITDNTPTVTGLVTNYSVNPSLPAGMSISSTTGVISGTPTDVTALAVYTVTASNAYGSTTCAVTITITNAPVAVIWVTSSGFATGMSASGSALTKTAAGGTWGNALAWSDQTVTGAGKLDVVWKDNTVAAMFGLTQASSIGTSSFDSIEYACYLNSTGNFNVYELGVAKVTNEGTYALNSTVTIETDGTTVVYKVNGALLYTSLTSAAGKTLKPVCAGYSQNQLNTSAAVTT